MIHYCNYSFVIMEDQGPMLGSNVLAIFFFCSKGFKETYYFICMYVMYVPIHNDQVC
jgi:hypothetical protein